jgi:cell division protein FtsI (penicillin-binding protein 3)
VLAFVLSLFGARLVQLQGLDAPTYAAEAEQGRLRTVTLPAARGTITDRNGIALATTVAAVNVTSDQTKVVDPAATAAVLAPVLQMDPAVLREKLTGDARFVYLAKAVTPATWRKISALDHPDPDIEGLPGIYAEQTSKRVYPAGQVGANIVGFVGADGKGLGGIEYALDSTLAGRDGTATYELSAGGRRIPSGVDTERDAVPGTDVRLTLDRDIQYVAQKAIAKAVASSQAQSGTVVVYDPKSGDLLAVATAPTFDPNDPGAAPAEDRGDRPLNEAYEPGSTGKIITASALI